MDCFVGPDNLLDVGTNAHIEANHADAAAFNQNYEFNPSFYDNGPEPFGWE